MSICKICENLTGGSEHNIKEMMFGTRTKFTYFQCDNCGCLQIKKVPQDIGSYYRAVEYYSFKTAVIKIKLKLIKRIIIWIKINKNIKFLFDFFCLVSLRFTEYFKWLNFIDKISFDSKILDVGCGSGVLLFEMRELGFKNLHGIDLYIQSSKNEQCVNIVKGDLSDVDGKFDLIMLHHSLEHMPDQNQVMHKINQLLPPGGVLIVRIPLVDCYAWGMYGDNWYQIDAPRHLYLHSSKSLVMLAKKHCFNLIHSYRDSTELQFSISEMYAKNVALNEIDPERLIKNAERYRKRAIILNAQDQGDQGCFIFKKIKG